MKDTKKIEEAIKEIEENQTLKNDTKILILGVLKEHLFTVLNDNARIEDDISFYEKGFMK